MRPALAIGFLLLTLALWPGRASAQGEMAAWLHPKLGEQIGRADYRYTLFPDEHVKGQSTDFSYQQHNVTFVTPLFQNTRDELMVEARGRLQEFETGAIFPRSGRRYPDELWDLRLSTTYRHQFDNAWIGGLSLTVGSASDKPFHSLDEVLVRGIAFLRVPHRERHAWFFTLFYDNDQETFSGIPIPGIAYMWVPSRTFTAVIGVPFSSVEWKPVESLTLEAQYFPVRRVRARATWQVARPVRAYIGFDWDSERHLLADREDDDDRLFYYEKRITAGARFDLRYVGVEVYGGYIFDRLYFQGDEYSDRHKDRFWVEPGVFVGARIGVRWGEALKRR